MNITVVGAVFVDIKGYSINKYIENGRNAGYIKEVHGGVARNAAEDLARVGVGSRFVSLVDKSGTAIQVIRHLKDAGVDTEFVKEEESGMGTWMAIFDEKGDVVSNISVRPDILPLAKFIDEKHKEIFENTDGILLEVDIDERVTERVFKYAELYQKKVYSFVSLMGDALERKKYIKKSECFICNRQEIGMLFNEDFEDGSIEELIKRLSQKRREVGIKSLIVTLGTDGSVYTSEDGQEGYCEAKKTKLVDSTGAGDAFAAGAAAALGGKKSLKEACEIGTIMASDVITTTSNVCKKIDGLF